MLVLSRMRDESVIIGDDVVVTVVDVHWGNGKWKVRLGISAPPEVRVDRSEVRASKDSHADELGIPRDWL